MDNLLARLIDGILRPGTDSADKPVLVAGRQLRTDCEQRGQPCGLHQIPPVVVNPVFRTSIAAGVRARRRSRTVERPPGRIRRFHTSNTRRCV